MKRMDFFCTSPASTAICSSVDHRSMVDRRGPRPIDRRSSSKFHAPCSSQLPINPKSLFESSRKSSAEQSDVSLRRKSFAASRESTTTTSVKPGDLRRKSSADIRDLQSSPPASSSRYLLSDVPYVDWTSESDHVPALLPSQHFKPRDPSSPARKSTSLGHSPVWVPESDHVHESALIPAAQTPKTRHISKNDYHPSARISSSSSSSMAMARTCDWVSKYDHTTAIVPDAQATKPGRMRSTNDSPALKSSSSARSRDQVVVLRVSIHCKGCEGKVRKHISKMEGVTSFSIDLAAKKVTVIGDVTPLGVLASVSKVKNAQLWPSPSSSPRPSPSPSPRWST